MTDRQTDLQTSDCPIWDTSIVVLASFSCRVSINREILLTDRPTDRQNVQIIFTESTHILLLFFNFIGFSNARYTCDIV